MHVAAIFGGETITVGLAQRSDLSIVVLLADPSADVTMTVIEAGLSV
jgi:hypothetical protein